MWWCIVIILALSGDALLLDKRDRSRWEVEYEGYQTNPWNAILFWTWFCSKIPERGWSHATCDRFSPRNSSSSTSIKSAFPRTENNPLRLYCSTTYPLSIHCRPSTWGIRGGPPGASVPVRGYCSLIILGDDGILVSTWRIWRTGGQKACRWST